MARLTPSEKQQKYRAKLKLNATKLEAVKAKDRQRKANKRETATKREIDSLRRSNAESKRHCRAIVYYISI